LIILDASAAIEFLLRAESVPELTEVLLNEETIACPVMLDLEILNVLRRQIQDKRVTKQRAEQALELYWALPLERFDTTLLSNRIWQLRNNFTSYDASYIALSEFLDVPLYTKDKKWRDQSGHKAEIHYI
jgi:predicted nucleic acid-binding protein